MTGYVSSIWQLRHFWLALVRNDLRRRYRGTMIGIGWSLLQPIAMTAVLCLIFGQIFNQPLREFAPYLLTGLTFWAFISAAVMQGCQSFFQGESYIRQHPAPLAIYPLRVILGAGFHFLLGFAIAVVFVWVLNGFGNFPALLYLIPTFALLFVLSWSLAVCMGVANVIFQDSQHLIGIVMQMSFYLTPIMYNPDEVLKGSPRLLELFKYNPFAMLLEMIRKPLLDGVLPSLWALNASIIFTLLALCIATLALRCFEKRMIFYL